MEEKILEIIKNKAIIVWIAVCIIIVGLIGIYVGINGMFNENIDTSFSIDQNEFINTESSVNEIIIEEKIKVYITGEVNNPGVLELVEGDRIEDAINKAGGITENATLDKVNLAYKLEDGQKVYIPNKNDNEDTEIVSTENGQNVINTTSKSSKININSASIEKLCEISGVGKALAQRIVEYRNTNGKFKSIEDLKNVSGIGDKKFESIKNAIEAK